MRRLTLVALLVTGCGRGSDERGRFEPAGPMTLPRVRHSATLLADGRVLVAGGATWRERSLPDGARTFLQPVTASELWDPVRRKWTPTGDMSGERQDHTATRLADGRVLVCCGNSREGLQLDAVGTAELWSPATGQWTETASLSPPRAEHAATLLRDGRVLVTGGQTMSRRLRTASVWDPSSGRWSSVASMPSPRVDHEMRVMKDGRVLVFGGVGDDAEPFPLHALIWDPALDVWSRTEALDPAYRRARYTPLKDGDVLLMTEHPQFGPPGTVQTAVWNEVGGSPRPAGDFALGRRDNVLTLLADGQVLSTGGQVHLRTTPSMIERWLFDGVPDVVKSSLFDEAELFDPNTGRWTRVDDLFEPRRFHRITPLPDGSALLTGGAGTSHCLNTTELWVPTPR